MYNTILICSSSIASQELIDFWNSLLNPTITSDWNETQEGKDKGKGKSKDKGEGEGTADDLTGTFLDLGANVYFLGNRELGSKLYLRKCYQELLEDTVGTISSGSNVVITGTPGIGKSYFLFFFMCHLRTTEPEANVILYRGSEEKWYLFLKEGVFTASKKHFDTKYMDDPNTWYLVDEALPLQVRAKTLLVSSPYKETYKEFRKTNVRIKYMPIWSKEEIDICRRV